MPLGGVDWSQKWIAHSRLQVHYVRPLWSDSVGPDNAFFLLLVVAPVIEADALLPCEERAAAVVHHGLLLLGHVGSLDLLGRRVLAR